MKFFIAFALIAAVASASPFLKPTAVSGDLAEVEQIIQAIQSPSTDPATAALLEALLLETLGIDQPAPTHPISVGPAIVDAAHPVAVGPAPVEAVEPVVAADLPLVQIILNINAAGYDGPNPVTVDMPAVDAPIAPGPLPVVPSPTPVQVIDTVPMPVQVVDSIPMPVQVVDTVPELIVPEPIAVAEPTLPVAPAVVEPETLN